MGSSDMDNLKKPSRLSTGLRRGLGLPAITMAAALAPALALAGDLNEISYDRSSDGTVQVHFNLSEPLAGEAGSFKIDNPARVAIDLPDVDNQTGSRQTEIGLGAVKSVMLAEANGKTRAVFNLDQSVPYSIDQNGNRVTVSFNQARQATTTESGLAVTDRGSSDATAMDAGQPIDFRRASSGAGRLLLDVGSTDAPMDIKRQGSQIVVRLPGTRLEEGGYNVNDFATPVERVDVRREGNGSRVTLKTKDAGEHLAYQTGNRLVVEVQPIPEEEQRTSLGKKEYTGERLTLKFQDIQVRPLLQLIADFTGNNIVVSDTVQGSISLRLENVPWDQALDLIMTTKGLSSRENGNVIYVAPTDEIAARDKAELAAREQAQQLAPLITDIIQINYAKADDIATLVRQSSGLGESAGEKKSDGNFLSRRGSITVDSRTNTLIVTDTGEALDRVRGLITQIDKPVKQVLIETRIVIATDNFSRELGIRWGLKAGFNRAGSTFGIGSTSPTISSQSPLPTDGTGQTVTGGDGWIVNTPVGGTETGALGLAILGSNVLLNLELQALQSEGRGKIVSNPKVLTTNGHTAVISQGVEIPYQSVSATGGAAIANTQFKEAILKTEVTPQITPNDNVIMDILVQKDEPGQPLTQGGQPPINTREVQTKVQVQNGQTVVLGGIYEFEQLDDVRKVPFFGDLPGLGNLFKSRLEDNSRFELLIFVTPKIVDRDNLANHNRGVLINN
ncbi:type IV pilus secretin PilQ [Guyparkeria sp. SB14A]|uniref:type IV pilus secretin PilQ n=1 Tax=Guyparkeria sp. SB14A TaxID=2571147 RepID=UPI00145E30F4|nr:type IV pilus secretin PilQ [Guyparkeria sp. SB14A]